MTMSMSALIMMTKPQPDHKRDERTIQINPRPVSYQGHHSDFSLIDAEQMPGCRTVRIVSKSAKMDADSLLFE